MKNYDMMAFGGKKWKQLMKFSGWVKRISHDRNNYEDGMKLEPRIFGRTGKDLEELFFGLHMLRMMTRTLARTTVRIDNE